MVTKLSTKITQCNFESFKFISNITFFPPLQLSEYYFHYSIKLVGNRATRSGERVRNLSSFIKNKRYT